MAGKIYIKILLCCSLLLSAGMSMPPPAGAVDATVRSWVMEQNHDIYGPCRVYVCPTGARAEFLKKGLVVITTGPKWWTSAFLPSAKKYAVVKTEEFRGVFVFAFTAFTGRNMTEMPVAKCNTEKVKEGEVVTYKTDKAYEDKQMAEFKRGEIAGHSIKKAAYRVYKFPGVPPQVDPMLARFYGVPRKPGVPKELKYNKVHNNEEVPFLSTSSLTEKVVSRSIFSVPPGFKETSSIEALMREGQSSAAGMNMLLEEMGR